MSESDSPDREPQIDTGQRREETHYEADADQQVRVAHLAKPGTPLPRHEATVGAGLTPETPGMPIEDVRVDTGGSSVWDARPPEGRAFQDVPAAGAPQASPLNDGRDSGGWALGYREDDAAELSDEPDQPKAPFPPTELVSRRAGG